MLFRIGGFYQRLRRAFDFINKIFLEIKKLETILQVLWYNGEKEKINFLYFTKLLHYFSRIQLEKISVPPNWRKKNLLSLELCLSLPHLPDY